jgi:RNA polymerase sigma-70 factor (ECF subfamily)
MRRAAALLLVAAWARTAGAQTFVNVTAESGLEAIRATKAPGYWMSGLLFVDLDGDGDLDFFFGAHHGEGGIVSLNDGRGHFTAVTSLSPSEIHIPYDLNEDGKLDVVLTENDGGGRWWMGGSGPGGLTLTKSMLTDPQARLQVLLDIDRDGKADWIAVGSGSGSGVKEDIRVHLGDGKGGLGPATALPGLTNLTDLVDLDGDGDKDALWARGNYPNSPPEPVETRVLRNDGMAFTDVTAQVGMAVPGLHIQGWGDVDQDGDIDLIGLENDGRFPVVVYLNDGKGVFSKKAGAVNAPMGRAVAANPGLATTADLDNDGIVDILIGGVSFFQVLRGTGGGSFVHLNAAWGGITSAGELPDASFAVGDMDGDGDLDLACYRTTQPQMLNVYRNDLPKKNWVNVRAVGLPGNKGAMGSTISVFEAGTDKRLWFEELSSTAKQVQLNSYFFAESERHFGLGDRATVDVAVHFYPSNKVVKKAGVPANTTVRIAEDGNGTIVMPPPQPPLPPPVSPADGGAAMPGADAGAARDAVATAADAGGRADAGGSGTGGAGGATGSGGAGAVGGGTGGAGGDAPPGPTPEAATEAGCGCRLGGGRRAPRPYGGAALVLALMVLGAHRSRRGRRESGPRPLVSSSLVAKSEAAVLAGVGGERLELESIYRQHAALVKRWALRLGGPTVDVEDVVHEVFLVAHRRLPEFRGDARITTWLYRITLHIAHKQARKQRTRRWLRGLAGAFADDVRSEQPGPYETVERQHAARTVYKALDGLNRNQRAVVILYEIEGLSGEEIAALMDTKISTVWVWLHRGRAKFLERLKALGEEGVGS